MGAGTPEEMKGLMEASPQETLLETSSPRDNRLGSPPGVSTCSGTAGQGDDGDCGERAAEGGGHSLGTAPGSMWPLPRQAA